jgi:hypothetical protein
MKTRIGLAAAAAAALAAFPAEAGMFKAKGFEPAVYYTGERPIERGDAVADLGILYIHGWRGGADDRTALCRRLAKNVAKRGAKPVVFAPMFPAHGQGLGRPAAPRLHCRSLNLPRAAHAPLKKWPSGRNSPPPSPIHHPHPVPWCASSAMRFHPHRNLIFAYTPGH